MRLKLTCFIVAAFGLVAVQSSFAADMPTKMSVKAAPMAAATPWTGFYVNGGVGYGMWAAEETRIDTASGVCTYCETQVKGGKGWLATIGAGYDYQFTPRIVAGVFGDISASSLKGNIADRAGLGGAADIKQTSSWAAGARAGWLVTQQTMSYINGGYTSARFSGGPFISFTDGTTPVGFSAPDFTARGWFLGGGVETSLAASWFLRTEYRYAYYGTKTLDETPATGRSITFKPTVQTVTGQVVYKFNGGLPAPAYPAMPVMTTNWTGIYANAGAGYGMWAADSNELSTATGLFFPVNAQRVGGKGYLGVVGAGYDWQFAPVWVVGAFGDFNISSLKGTIQDQFDIRSAPIKQTSAWAGGARLGWLPSPQTMTYVNGGYTSARFSDGTFVTNAGAPLPTATTTPAFTANGWFLGGGAETTFDFFGMLGKGWFWRNEYRYAQYGNKVVPVANGLVPLVINFKPTVQTVTSSIVFKLN